MEITIGNRKIGPGQPTFVVAELSANHNQDLNVAVETIKAAKEAGADAVKLQTYTADTITLDCDSEYFKVKGGTLWDGLTLHELYDRAHTPWEWQPKLKKVAEDLGLICFSAPFDKSAVDFLADLGMPAFKVASPEIVDIPLIEYMARQGKPMIMSTGVAEEKDIREALEACWRQNNNQIILLKCTCAYPTPLEEVNLRTLPDFENRFGVLAGLSDHTQGIAVPIAAVALGATVVEKHIILRRDVGGPDADFSLEASEFRSMVAEIRNVEKALGRITYELTDNMKCSRRNARSLFISADVKAGDRVTEENIRSIRPGQGLEPKYLGNVLGKRFANAYRKGTPLRWECLEQS